LSFHHRHGPGELIERLDGDVSILANFFSRFVLRLVGSAALLLGILILLFREDWRIGLVLLGFSAVTAVAVEWRRRVGTRYFVAPIQQIAAEPRAIEQTAGLPIPRAALAVEFRNVGFRYHEREAVLDDVSFRLEPGRVLGVLGRTGSGKTTLARLLARLYDPD